MDYIRCVLLATEPGISLIILTPVKSGFFPWDLPVVEISPEWVTGPEQGKSSGRVATFSLWEEQQDTLGQIIKQINTLRRN